MTTQSDSLLVRTINLCRATGILRPETQVRGGPKFYRRLAAAADTRGLVPLATALRELARSVALTGAALRRPPGDGRMPQLHRARAAHDKGLAALATTREAM